MVTYSITGNLQQSEDLAQETFVTVWLYEPLDERWGHQAIRDHVIVLVVIVAIFIIHTVAAYKRGKTHHTKSEPRQ